MGGAVVTAVDRMSDGYEPNWDVDLAVGKQGELYVASIADMLKDGTGRVEVKTDEKATKYERIYVEYECKKFGGWAKSGIATTTADIWAVVLGGDTVLAVPTWRLKQAARRVAKNPMLRKECVKGSHPTKGVVIPFEVLLVELFKED